MSLMSEYIKKNLHAKDYEQELQQLIAQYNEIRSTYLFVYASDMVKKVPGCEIVQDDYYTICDILGNVSLDKLDVLIETPGGSGSTAEDIVRFIRSKFQKISFIVPGEAKSAGTILALSGDDIIMSATGSLGPIDAQVQIGRSRVSAYDYLEWIDEKRREASQVGRLNPVDAVMIAQVSPGEYRGVFHALKYAEDLVKEWLPKYKFKDWNVSETRGIPITNEMKEQRAKKIAETLTKHSAWRDHGRSIKREDLESVVELKVIHTESIEGLDEVVKRIHTLMRLYFGSTQVFKMFYTADDRIVKVAASREIKSAPRSLKEVACLNIDVRCEKCGKVHKFYAKFKQDPNLDDQQKRKGFSPLPLNGLIACDCGFTINIAGLRNQLEIDAGRKIVD